MKNIISSVLLALQKYVNLVFSTIVNLVFAILWTVLWLPIGIMQAFKPSYYPEKKRKNSLVRVCENVWYTVVSQRANGFYNLYGQDMVNCQNGFISEKHFWKGLKKANYSSGNLSQVCLLRDKYLFFKYMKANGMPVPDVFAVVKDGKLYNNILQPMEISELGQKQQLFMKDTSGECASFVKRVHSVDELQELITENPKGMFILQESVLQHHELNRLNPCAINTLRIVTVLENGKPKVLTSLLRVGTKETGSVDNWAAGGLAIGINDNGYLKQYGLYKPGHGTKADKHPDTGVVFEEYCVPEFRRALEAACEAHSHFYGLGAIGWDVAITESGPVFIEGNDNFEITLMQACDRPLKNEWKSLF